MLAFARMGREAGCLVAVDADSTEEGVADLLAVAHVVICPEHFPAEYTRKRHVENGLRAIHGMGPSLVCATRGADGAMMILHGDLFEEPGFEVDVVDTTGAGDVFHGAFLVGILERLAPRELLRFANAAAAMKCAHLGGQRGIPKRVDVDRFLSGESLAGKKS
jgi:sugar/nucleoside kinase (ribokinase family)